MDEKGSKITHDVKMAICDIKRQESPLNYRKETRIFDVKDHKQEIKVRKVITGLEDKQIQFKWFKKEVIILIIYLMAIIASEIVTAHYSIEYGLIMHTLILSALLICILVIKIYMFS